MSNPTPGSSRVIPQFLGHLLRGEPIQLVDGGRQQRTFTYIDDGIDGLMCILRNARGLADRQIFNLGNPDNFYSVRALATMMIEELAVVRGGAYAAPATLRDTTGGAYYGQGYEDVGHRRPCIDSAKRLGWSPRVEMRDGLRRLMAADVPGLAPALVARPLEIVATLAG